MEHSLGIIGLGTMGAALARNAARHGAFVVVYNRTTGKVDEFLEKYASEGNIVGRKNIEELVTTLPRPRAILLMVDAGDAVDEVLKTLVPILEKGDILIDGGNSHYRDTERRAVSLAPDTGIRYLGMGVSGGERGALEGPSLMPGGDESAYKEVEHLLKAVSADDGLGGKCVSYLGSKGAGHFVKMVHNGIEYGLMQIIAEAYDYLKTLGKFTNEQLSDTFDAWSRGDDVGGFLMEVTANIFRKKEGDGYLVDLIGDSAGSKGTGAWVVESALHYGVPVPTISASLEARILSGDEELREYRNKNLPEALDMSEPLAPHEKMRSIVRSAVELAMILTFTQGFRLMKRAGAKEKWNLNLSEVARIWRGGCIIRSVMLSRFEKAFSPHESESGAAKEALIDRFDGERQYNLRHVVDLGTSRGVPLPAMCSALSYYDSIRRDWLPQNLTQAQRDYFGAHGYQRVDKGGDFHTEWK